MMRYLSDDWIRALDAALRAHGPFGTAATPIRIRTIVRGVGAASTGPGTAGPGTAEPDTTTPGTTTPDTTTPATDLAYELVLHGEELGARRVPLPETPDTRNGRTPAAGPAPAGTTLGGAQPGTGTNTPAGTRAGTQTSAQAGTGTPAGDEVPATVTFSVDAATAAAIASGAQSAQAAFMAGRLRVHGDTRQLMDHQALLAELDDVFAPVRAVTDFAIVS